MMSRIQVIIFTKIGDLSQIGNILGEIAFQGGKFILQNEGKILEGRRFHAFVCNQSEERDIIDQR